MVQRKQTKSTAAKADSSEDEVKSEIEYVFSESNGEEASGEDSEIEAKIAKKKKKVLKKSFDEESDLNEEEIPPTEKKAKTKKSISKTQKNVNDGGGGDDEDGIVSFVEEEKIAKKKKKALKKSFDKESDSNEEEMSPSKKKKTKTKKTISKTEKDAGGGDDDEDEIVGFADAISRILERTQIPVGKKHTILAKGKTDREIQKHKLNRLLESNPEAVKEEIPDSKDHKEKLKERKIKLLLARTKPNVLEINKERQLKAVATQGIVQLFNAVQKQQKLNEENENTINTTEWKKQKISETSEQTSFFHLLQNMPKVNLSSQPEDTIKPEPERKIWNFLKDDFILDSTKMKDWDKKESV